LVAVIQEAWISAVFFGQTDGGQIGDGQTDHGQTDHGQSQRR
jgi:hypothetical protein